MNHLFTEIPIPRHHRREDIAGRARWYSWSPASIRLIETNLDRITALSDPCCISVRGCNPYSSTYSYRLSALSEPLVAFALDAAEALLRLPTGRSMRFLGGMLNPPLSSSVLHKCFALIRAGVARLKSDPRAALHPPVKTERMDEGFLPHRDLFLTERLWLVFDDVPTGRSGRALLLPSEVLDDAMKANHLIPSDKRRRLQILLSGRVERDCFDECYDLLHSPDNPWAVSLADAMKRGCWAIKFRRGEGYLLNDRRWLHGRTAVRGGVSETRFHRLTYGDVLGS